MTGVDAGTACRRERGREEGAYAILFAALLLVFFGFAAFAMDIASHVEVKQDLHDTLDAAAHAGATHLPATTSTHLQARQAAIDYARANDPTLVGDPQVEFWCMLSNDGGTPRLSQVVFTCDGLSHVGRDVFCEGARCAIPCFPDRGETCNTVRVIDAKAVPYTFAPAIGQDEGSTGSLNGAACRGPCGAEIVGDLDLVLVLDRTPSMVQGGTDHVELLVQAVEGMLGQLDTSRHHVALFTQGPTDRAGSCPTAGVDRGVDGGNDYLDFYTDWQTKVTGPRFDRRHGSWLAVEFSDDYQEVPASEPPVLASPGRSRLIHGLDCLEHSDHGTDLGDPIRAAARYLDDRGRDGVPGAVVFMSDGQPTHPHANGSTGDSWSDLQNDCDYARSQADGAWNDIRGDVPEARIVTIAYRLQGVEIPCGGGIDDATELLAAMASETTAGDDDQGCATGVSAAENDDDDNFYCAPDPGRLAEVFVKLAADLTQEIRLVRIAD